MQDQLRQAKESVSNMQKLHELAQSQMFELRAQSGKMLILNVNTMSLFYYLLDRVLGVTRITFFHPSPWQGVIFHFIPCL